jgi:hypothetical protein
MGHTFLHCTVWFFIFYRVRCLQRRIGVIQYPSPCSQQNQCALETKSIGEFYFDVYGICFFYPEEELTKLKASKVNEPIQEEESGDAMLEQGTQVGE